MINIIKLNLVDYMPKVLEPGVLYVSKKFSTAAHMCPCGCGNKVVTPLGPTEWSLRVKHGRPTLRPSIGNWQIPCRSHYWIIEGTIDWGEQWAQNQILAGRTNEETRRVSYFNKREQNRRTNIFKRIINWLFDKE